MGTEEKKGITVKVDADLHAEVRRYLEQNGMTMGEFVAIALHNELHPKITEKEDTQMGNMRTLAFQVPEDLFQKIKDYLTRHGISQKQFVIGLIEKEIDRDLNEINSQTASETDDQTEYEEDEYEEADDDEEMTEPEEDESEMDDGECDESDSEESEVEEDEENEEDEAFVMQM